MSESRDPITPGATTGRDGDPSMTDGPSASDPDSWVPPPPDPRLTDEAMLEAQDRPSGTTFRLKEPRGTEWSSWPEEPGETVQAPPGFVLLGECGRGGMGVVYLAEQTGLGRRVAIKVLKGDLAASDGDRARFQVEARALGRMQHPHIVQVFDFGTIDGRSYLIQEFVEGGSLDQLLARRPMAHREAALLVATLARAIGHAHEWQIVHRDLKPANVLMTKDGVPKIGDFGLAKQLDLDQGQTRTGAIVGSPSYMAPEQALGGGAAIGPAVDIYALGAILYEALTGRPPFLTASVLETLEQVRSADPVPPRRLDPALPRDLETICLKCLFKDPLRRYPTASELADDIDRFLEGRPILARPVSAGERLVKWVRRKPATAAASTMAIVAAVAILVGSLIYQGLLRSARDQSESNAQQARLEGMRADARYRQARATLVKMIERLDDRRLSETPRLQELREQYWQDALAYYREVVKDREDPSPAMLFDVAEACIQTGRIQWKLGQGVESSQQFQQAIDRLEPLIRAEPGRVDYRFALARSYVGLGAASGLFSQLSNQERSERAIPQYDRAIGLLTRLVQEEPENPSYGFELAQAHLNLATNENDLGHRELAESHFLKAIEIATALLAGPLPGNRDVQLSLAAQHRNLAGILQGQKGRFDASQDQYTECRRLLLEVLKAEPENVDASFQLGDTLSQWAISLSDSETTARRAEELFQEGIQWLEPIVRREPKLALARSQLLSAHGGRAQLLQRADRYAEAVRDWERVVELSVPERKDHYRFFLATCCAAAGDDRRAMRLVEELKASLPQLAPGYVMELANICNRAIEAILLDSKRGAAERESLTQTYGREGVSFLGRYLERFPEAERAKRRQALREHPMFERLRERADCRALLAEPSAAVKSGASTAHPGNK